MDQRIVKLNSLIITLCKCCYSFSSLRVPTSRQARNHKAICFFYNLSTTLYYHIYIYIYLYHECPQVNFAKTGDAKPSCWMMSVHTLFKKLGSWEMTINVVLVIDRRYSESHSTDSLSSQKLPNLVHLALQSKRIPATKTWKEIYKETGEPWEKPIGHHSLQRPQQRWLKMQACFSVATKKRIQKTPIFFEKLAPSINFHLQNQKKITPPTSISSSSPGGW